MISNNTNIKKLKKQLKIAELVKEHFPHTTYSNNSNFFSTKDCNPKFKQYKLDFSPRYITLDIFYVLPINKTQSLKIEVDRSLSKSTYFSTEIIRYYYNKVSWNKNFIISDSRKLSPLGKGSSHEERDIYR